MTRIQCNMILAVVTLPLLLLLGGCEMDKTMGGLIAPSSSVMVVLDKSMSCWDRVRKITTDLGTVYMGVQTAGQKSPVTLLVGGQGTEWLVDGYGVDRQQLRNRLAEEAESQGFEGQCGTDVCAMLQRVNGFIAQNAGNPVTIVIAGDFCNDPKRDENGQLLQTYKDPADFEWIIPEPDNVKIRLYFTDDAQMDRLAIAWAKQLKNVDVKWFRPNHMPHANDR